MCDDTIYSHHDFEVGYLFNSEPCLIIDTIAYIICTGLVYSGDCHRDFNSSSLYTVNVSVIRRSCIVCVSTGNRKGQHHS
jgi:hypothetical protein